MVKLAQVQASRFASGAAMAKALERARNSINVGDWITVRKYSSTSNTKRTMSGTVIYKNRFYFVVQGKHYREAFTFIDVVLGQVEVIRKRRLWRI